MVAYGPQNNNSQQQQQPPRSPSQFSSNHHFSSSSSSGKGYDRIESPYDDRYKQGVYFECRINKNVLFQTVLFIGDFAHWV